MKTEQEVRKELKLAYALLRSIENDQKKYPVGECHWRMTKRYIEALEFVLGEE